jgi:enoyl-CoA hydratase
METATMSTGKCYRHKMMKRLFSLTSRSVPLYTRIITPFSTNNLDETFKLAVKSIEKGPNAPKPKKDVDNMMKLQLYSTYKQATEGNVKGERPGMFNMVDRAKYDAWKSLDNLSKDDAQKKYINIVKDIFGGEIPLKTLNNGPSTSSVSPNSTHADSAAAKIEDQHKGALSDFSGPRYSSLEDIALVRKRNLKPPSLKTVLNNIDTKSGVGMITLNRPNRGNAFDFQQWEELRQTFNYFNVAAEPRVIILNGAGNSFCTGMDLTVFMKMQEILNSVECDARKREAGIFNMLNYLQGIISAPENCPVPVIAAIHGHCIGGAVDLITATDLRYCTKDSTFCVKETDLAIVADMGTLQRLPKLIGTQQALELTYTGRNFTGVEAEKLGLVVKAFDSKEEMMNHVTKVAEQIAKKSPITTRGIKKTVLYARDHSVEDSLNQVKLWNSAFMYSNDLVEAAMSIMSKKEPQFKDD